MERAQPEDMAGRSPAPGARSAGSRTLSAEKFAALFQESARVLWTIAAGVLGHPSEAEDVLQEACVMALGKLEQFEPDTNFAAWMGSFVRNVALNHRRKRLRRATETVDPHGAHELHGGNGRDASRGARDHAAGEATEGAPFGLPIDERGSLREHQAAFDDRVLGALCELAEEPRATLLLRIVLGLSYREIAGVLGIPEGTAMSHVHRAREALRERLSDEDDASASDARTAARRAVPGP